MPPSEAVQRAGASPPLGATSLGKAGPRTVPASQAQQAVWALDQSDSGTEICKVTATVHLTGAVDAPALKESLASLVRRHEVLRTAFLYRESGRRSGRLIQVISPEMDVDLPILDLCGLPAAKRAGAARRLTLEASQSSFDLTRLPLFRVQLLALDGDEHILHLLAHRIIMDEAAAGLFLRDLFVLYSAHRSGQMSSLPATQPYADISNKEIHRLGDRKFDAQLAYWTEKLRGPLPVLELPSDRSRVVSQPFLPAHETLALPLPLSTALRSLSVHEQATVSVLLLAAFKVLLHRYTQLEDVLVGSFISGRRSPEEENILGPLENVLVLRTDVSGNPTFLELLHRVRNVAEAANAHRDVPFERVLQVLRTNGSLASRLPFQIRFDLARRPSCGFQGVELRAASVEIDSPNAFFDLSVSVADDAEEIGLSVRYNAELFSPLDIVGVLSSFRTLLEGIVACPNERILALPLLTGAQRHRVLVECNDTAVDYPRDRCVHELFESQVERTPDAVALVCGTEQLTYRELNEGANRLARLLIERGIGPDRLVGICIERSCQLPLVVLAVLKAGGAYVPLDPAYPDRRLAYMVEDSSMPIMITEKECSLRFPAHQAQIISLDESRAILCRYDPGNVGRRSRPEHLAYMIYTSGSTGQPKGVMIEHRSVVNLLHSMRREPGLNRNDTLLAVTTLSFDMAGLELHLPLTTGAQIVIARTDDVRDASRLSQLLASSQATVMQATPATWRLLVESGWPGDSRLKALCGGEALHASLARALLDRCGSLWNLYGPTETTIWSSGCQVFSADGPIPLGRPIANTQFYVLDGELNPLPPGVTGELYIGGDGLARGYHNRPDLTAEKFVPDPFSGRPAGRLYRTGDLVRCSSDGTLRYLGRIDHQVKIRGFRIELGEIEAALRSRGDIHEAVVVAREDAPGSRRLVAYFVPSQASSPPSAELRRFLKERLPDYMIPSAFVVLGAFPLTPNGKVDRRMLPAPESERSETASGFVPPRDSVEARLAQIWEEILDIHPIGVRDDYFDLGAESLQAALIFARISKKFGRTLSPSTLFKAPTIEQLAKLLSQAEGRVQWSSLVPIQPLGSQSPLFCVHGGAGTVLFFHNLARHLGRDRPLYALQAQGLYDASPAHTSVEQMAAHYIREIRSVQPEGPYYLAGYCFGILVALEMAHQLESQGQAIGLLASINGTAPGYAMTPPGVAAIPMISAEVSHEAGAFRQLQPREKWASALKLLARSARRVAFYLFRISRLHGAYWRLISLAMKHYRSRQPHQPLPARIRNRFFLYNTFWAEKEYRPRPYAGRLVIFRAKGLYHDPLLGWGKLVTGGIEVHEIPGAHRDHRNIVEEPAVGTLAEQVRKLLLSQSASESRTGGMQSKTETRIAP